MICIFQVLGKVRDYSKKEFVIKEFAHKSLFSSDVLRKKLLREGKQTSLVFFVPESLLTDADLSEYEQKLKEVGIEDFECIELPSAGKVGGWSFRSAVETITSSIFLEILKRRSEKLYVDVSTGQNIYTIPLMEAAKRYLTYRKLERLLQEDCRVKAEILFTPPIVDVERYHVEMQSIDVKAFFALPNADVDNLCKEVPDEMTEMRTEVNIKYDETKKKFGKMYKELKIAFNAIRLNTPLAFYQILSMDLPADEIESEVMEFVEELLKPMRKEKEVLRMGVDGVNVSNIFYSIALYKSIQEFAKTLSEAEISEIFEKFRSIYRVKSLGTGVNEYFLERDVDDIKEVVKTALNEGRIYDGGEELYGKLKHGEVRKSKDQKRNFFAHSGFLQEITLVRVRGGKIFVRWMDSEIKTAKKWIEKPEK